MNDHVLVICEPRTRSALRRVHVVARRLGYQPLMTPEAMREYAPRGLLAWCGPSHGDVAELREVAGTPVTYEVYKHYKGA